MTYLLLATLMVIAGWLAIIQLLNSQSQAGALARRLAEAIIERIAGRGEKEAAREAEEESAP